MFLVETLHTDNMGIKYHPPYPEAAVNMPLPLQGENPKTHPEVEKGPRRAMPPKPLLPPLVRVFVVARPSSN